MKKEVKDKKGSKQHDSIVKLIWRLLKYTQGHNEKQVSMKFHFPVFVQVETTSSSDENDTNNTIKIMATLPKEYQSQSSQVPKPAEQVVKIENINEFKCYARYIPFKRILRIKSQNLPILI